MSTEYKATKLADRFEKLLRMPVCKADVINKFTDEEIDFYYKKIFRKEANHGF